MNDLIARLEALEGPDREADAQLHCAAMPHCSMPSRNDCAQGSGYVSFRDGAEFRQARPYTSSIDAAMTLAEPGDAAQVLDEAIRLLGLCGWRGRWRDALPRFICIAAMKAREQQP